jgi:predicted nuclease with TOPRIM domain
MSISQQDLLDLKSNIEEAKDAVSELKGKKSNLLQRLQEEWDCANLAEAERRLEELDGELIKVEEKIEKKSEALEKEYDFN